MKYALALMAALIVGTAALAEQHGHGEKGPKGGPMEDVAGLHPELIASGNTITINIYDEAVKPIPTKGFSGSALVTRGKDRETVKLEPADTNVLRGEAKSALKGVTIAVALRTAAGKSGPDSGPRSEAHGLM
ncbi:MAG: hypothetical protein K2Y71_15570 [Xanthobacteraceae bacterium]|nr:hypothetical protein [Xanthobacteraceae bacterium]